MSTLVFAGLRRRSFRASAVGSLLARARAVLLRMRDERRLRAASRQLRRLNDWQLKDIGMHRGQMLYLGFEDVADWRRSHHAEH